MVKGDTVQSEVQPQMRGGPVPVHQGHCERQCHGGRGRESEDRQHGPPGGSPGGLVWGLARPGCSDLPRPRGRPPQGLDIVDESAELGEIGVAVPGGETDGMACVERDSHGHALGQPDGVQFPLIPSMQRLCIDPSGRHRWADHSTRTRWAFFSAVSMLSLKDCLRAHGLDVPPDLEPFVPERPREALGLVPVLSGVADEDVGQGSVLRSLRLPTALRRGDSRDDATAPGADRAPGAAVSHRRSGRKNRTCCRILALVSKE